MSAVSAVRPMQTLKGIFEEPKMPHRRDFLRENKLSLRAGSKKLSVSQQKTQQQKEQQAPQKQQLQKKPINKSIQQQPQRQDTLNKQQLARQRSASQQHTATTNYKDYQPMRSLSQQHRNQKSDVTDIGRCSSCGCTTHGEGSGGKARRNVSRGTLTYSKTDASHKEIQTDDIRDEAFLYNALKKCGSENATITTFCNNNVCSHSDTNVSLAGHSTNLQETMNKYEQQPQQEYDTQSYYGKTAESNMQIIQSQNQVKANISQQLDTDHQRNQPYYAHQTQHLVEDTNLSLSSARSNISQKSDAHTQTAESGRSRVSQHTVKSQHTASQHSHLSKHLVNGEVQNRPSNSQMEKLDKNYSNINLTGEDTNEQQLSARSQHTVYSSQSQETLLSKTHSVHKLGSRDDVRLPRYLEREKREKEEQRLREMQRDPNCPLGHYVLPEADRLTALTAAEKNYNMLVQELNRMPMTTETLRIRSRKVEIEKQLAVLEGDIRIFSKPKVYVKQPE